MFVEQLVNKNQFVIIDNVNNYVYFQSYKSMVATIDKDLDLTLEWEWDYSKTTLKHLKIFLSNYNWNGKELLDFSKPFKKQIEKLIKNGVIIRGY